MSEIVDPQYIRRRQVTRAGVIRAFGKLDRGYTPRGWRRAIPEDWLARDRFHWVCTFRGWPYPPKRVVAVAAGLPLRDFHTDAARRVLANLGFSVVEKTPETSMRLTPTQRRKAVALRQPVPFDPDAPETESILAVGIPGATPDEVAAAREKAVNGHRSILRRLGWALLGAGWTDLEQMRTAVDLQATPPVGPRVLFEAKTITSTNELHQVRNGLAQLLEYRLLGRRRDGLCLVTNAPIRTRRVDVLQSVGIDWLWIDGDDLFTYERPLLASLRRVVNVT